MGVGGTHPNDADRLERVWRGSASLPSVPDLFSEIRKILQRCKEVQPIYFKKGKAKITVLKDLQREMFLVAASSLIGQTKMKQNTVDRG